MSENVLKNVRIVHKHDTEENWLKATNFIPKQGELIIYDVDDKYNYERMKIGDGNTLVNDLPFSNDWESLENRPFYTKKNYIGETKNISFVNGIANFIIPIEFEKIEGSSKTIQIDFVNVSEPVISNSSNTEADYSFIGEYSHRRYGVSMVDIFLYEGKDHESGFNITLQLSGRDDEFNFTHSHPNASNTFTTDIIFYEIEQKQIDEKFIPETIARKSDIPEENLYIVNLYGNETDGYTADRTREEIYEAALNDSLRVICRHTNDANETKNFELASASPIGITFSYVAGLGSGSVSFSKYGKPILVKYYAFQNATDDLLETDSKEVYKAINELHSEINEHTEALNLKADISLVTDVESALYNAIVENDIEDKAYVDEKIAAIPQSDWNEDDPASAAYIQNRTHYLEKDGTLLSETTLSREPLIDSWDLFMIKPEKTYHVTFDGVRYECVCKAFGDDWPYYIGNGSLYDDGCEDTGEPFCITLECYYSAVYYSRIYMNVTRQHTLAIDEFFIGETTVSSNGDYIVVPMVAGETYEVIWDGVTYNVEAKAYGNGGVYIGNLGLAAANDAALEGAEDTGEPFCITKTGVTTTEGEHTFSVAGLIPERTHDFKIIGTNRYDMAIPLNIGFDFVAGETYKIIFDGTEYEFVWTDDNGIPYMGNGSIGSLHSEDTGEPFCIMYASKHMYEVYIYNGSYTLEIKGDKYHTIDEVYLPTLVGKLGQDGSSEIFNSYEYNVASGNYSHAENYYTEATGFASHAEGGYTEATGNYSHAEGGSTKATGNDSHAEGSGTKATGHYSHAEGQYSEASGNTSHAEGYQVTASGDYSHVEGYYTKASSKCQHVQGRYNIEDASNKYLHVVGNGDYSKNTGWKEVRSNAHTLDWNGLGWFAGGLKVGGTSQDDVNAKLIATEEYVNRETAGVQNHLVDNDLHVVLGERAKWNAAYDHSQDADMHNAYSSFSFENAISTYAAEPDDPTDSTPTDFNVSAQTSNHHLKFIATNNLIEFNASDMRDSDEVEITIHADPEGAADEAEANAKAYADSIKNDLLNGAGAAYDTLKELGELIDENHDAITVLEQVATNKADKTEIPTIDSEINSESQNPVQNKVIKEYIDNKVVQEEWYATTTIGNKVIWEEMTLNGDGWFSLYQKMPKLTVGKTYIVNWNGTEYTCQLKQYNNHIYLGNYSDIIGAPTSDNNEPFLILLLGNNYYTEIYDIDFELTQITFSITEVDGENANEIPNKFLGFDWVPKKVETYVDMIPTTECVFKQGYHDGTLYTGGSQLNNYNSGYDKFSFIDGNWYLVTYDNVVYYVQAKAYSQGVTIGNHSYGLAEGEETLEPFCLKTYTASPTLIPHVQVYIEPLADGEVQTHTFRVQELDMGYEKLPEKYLPDSYIILRSPNGTKFKIEIDDNGILSATSITE